MISAETNVYLDVELGDPFQVSVLFLSNAEPPPPLREKIHRHSCGAPSTSHNSTSTSTRSRSRVVVVSLDITVILGLSGDPTQLHRL